MKTCTSHVTAGLLVCSLLLVSGNVGASGFNCGDLISVSKLVASGKTWTDSEKAYAHSVRNDAADTAEFYLSEITKRAEEGDQHSQRMLTALSAKIRASGVKTFSDIALRSAQRVHLAEDRVKSLGLSFDQCVAYGIGAWAGS